MAQSKQHAIRLQHMLDAAIGDVEFALGCRRKDLSTDLMFRFGVFRAAETPDVSAWHVCDSNSTACS